MEKLVSLTCPQWHAQCHATRLCACQLNALHSTIAYCSWLPLFLFRNRPNNGLTSRLVRRLLFEYKVLVQHFLFFIIYSGLHFIQRVKVKFLPHTMLSPLFQNFFRSRESTEKGGKQLYLFIYKMHFHTREKIRFSSFLFPITTPPFTKISFSVPHTASSQPRI